MTLFFPSKLFNKSQHHFFFFLSASFFFLNNESEPKKLINFGLKELAAFNLFKTRIDRK